MNCARFFSELAASIGLLTRIPLGPLLPEPASVNYGVSVWAWPLASTLVGALGGVAHAIAIWTGMPPFLAASWTLIVLVLLTGGLHEDGMADTADGLGGGRTPARALEIMRDSRIGSYGALALILSLTVRIAAITAIGSSMEVTEALIAAEAVGRAGMVLVLRRTRPARPDGMAAMLGTIPAGSAWASLVIAGIIILIMLPILPALSLITVAIIASLAWSHWVNKRIGGHTGDTLGAIKIAIECLALSIIAAGFNAG